MIRKIEQSGFTLAEMAVVLVIITLLLGGLLMPLSGQRDVQQSADTQKQLNEIRDALIGFAIINKRLPCPSTTTDPTSASYGAEDASPCNAEGYLPWKTLGVSGFDAWGVPRSAISDPFTGFWRYRVDAGFSTGTISNTSTTTSALVVSNATSILSGTGEVVAVIYSTGPDKTQNGLNSTGAGVSYQQSERSTTFDDQLVWISRSVLIGRMTAAGAIP